MALALVSQFSFKIKKKKLIFWTLMEVEESLEGCWRGNDSGVEYLQLYNLDMTT